MKLDWRSAAAWRMRRHSLAERAPRRQALDVVARVAGLHAQLMSSAELSLWARVEGVRRDTVRRALWRDRRLVKTWAMRGTLHLLPAREYPTWQAALGTYDHYLKPAWFKAFGITRAELEALIDAVGEALDGAVLTREELATAVVARTGDAALGEKLLESWGVYLKPASFRGRLCFAPDRGRNVCFTHPRAWLHGLEPSDPEQAVAAVTRRWLGAYGPARREDLGRWWGCSPAQAGKRIAALGDEVAAVEVDGEPAFLLAADVEDAAAAAPTGAVRLLPAFDPYVVGASRDPSGVVPEPERERVYRRAGGWISPVLLVDGVMAGVWRSETSRGRVAVEIEAFSRLPKAVREAAAQEAAALAAFLGAGLDLRVQ